MSLLFKYDDIHYPFLRCSCAKSLMTKFEANVCCFLYGFCFGSQIHAEVPSEPILDLNAYLLVFAQTKLNHLKVCSWKCQFLFLSRVEGSDQLHSKLDSTPFDPNSLVLEFDLTTLDLDWNYYYYSLMAFVQLWSSSFNDLVQFCLGFSFQLIFASF